MEVTIKVCIFALTILINNLLKNLDKGYLKPDKMKAKSDGRVKDWENNLSKKGPGYRKPGSQKK